MHVSSFIGYMLKVFASSNVISFNNSLSISLLQNFFYTNSHKIFHTFLQSWIKLYSKETAYLHAFSISYSLYIISHISTIVVFHVSLNIFFSQVLVNFSTQHHSIMEEFFIGKLSVSQNATYKISSIVSQSVVLTFWQLFKWVQFFRNFSSTVDYIIYFYVDILKFILINFSFLEENRVAITNRCRFAEYSNLWLKCV